MRRPSTYEAVVILLCVISFIVYVEMTAGVIGDTHFDDAYMVTRYAKHWLMGKGFSWNISDGPAYGITTPSYLFLITAVVGITHCSDAIALTVTSYLAGLASVLILIVLGFIVQIGNQSRISWSPLLVAPAILLVGPFPYHSCTGMETTLSLFVNSLLACAIVVAVRLRTRGSFLFCLVAGFLSFETRPDNGLYALFLPPLFFIATHRGMWRDGLLYVLLISGLVFCSLMIHSYLFADMLPLPFYAKSVGFYKGYIGARHWNAVRYMLDFWIASAPFLLTIVATVSRRSLPQVVVVASLICATFFYYATVTQVMGFSARYYYPSLAFVVLAAYLSAYTSRESLKPSEQVASASPRLLCALAVVLLAISDPLEQKLCYLWQVMMIGEPVAIQSHAKFARPTEHQLPQIGEWDIFPTVCQLLKEMPDEMVFAAGEHGFVGSQYPQLTIIDLVGLHDRTIAHHGMDAGYVFGREPDLIWFPHSAYTGSVAAILDHPTFQSDYEYYPGAYDYGIAIRRTSEMHERIVDQFAREFARVYGGVALSDYVAHPVADSHAQ